MELRDLKSQKAAEQGLISKEDHEGLRLSLQVDINAITARFNDLTRKHEKTCTEVCVCVCLCVCVYACMCVCMLACVLLFLASLKSFLMPSEATLDVFVSATK